MPNSRVAVLDGLDHRRNRRRIGLPDVPEFLDRFLALSEVVLMPCKRLFDFTYLYGKIGGLFVAKLNGLFLDHFEVFEHFFSVTEYFSVSKSSSE